MESSARRARYLAFDAAIHKYQPDFFFLAHTKNDQAETVLLGLARGSGTRSLSGIAEVNGSYIRPILGLDRETTTLACAENGIVPWEDPHNSDMSYARVRVRKQVLPALEENLGPGIIDSLARSANILREDADALDQLAEEYFGALSAPLDLSADHLAPIEALVTDWHGQGEVSLPGGVKVARISGRLSLLR